MIKIGVSLVDPNTGEELQHWEYLPNVITHLGEERTGAIVGSEFNGGALLVDRYCENECPYGDDVFISSETSRFENGIVVVTRVYSPPPLDLIKTRLVNRIKTEAGLRILNYCPQYKQANLTAQAAELALTFPDTKGEDLPEPYKTQWTAGQVIWNNIKSIRAHSNTLEAEVTSKNTVEDLLSWEMYGWPKI